MIFKPVLVAPVTAEFRQVLLRRVCRALLLLVVSVTFWCCMNTSYAADSLYAISADTIDGESVSLSKFSGKVALVVNVASQCGYTRQYAGLEQLYEEYQAKGFVILGFPSNDFGGQEPGSNSEIKQFCSSKFGVTFPLFAKVPVLGDKKHPVYQYLTAATGGAEVGWNFEKFLVDKSGRVIARFESSVGPESSELRQALEKALS